ncbi:MAG: hypothetical protein Kow00109_21930 [Acidobacteriota bacterium]
MAYFAASVDDPETNHKFAESLGADYPILSDPTKETARAFGVLHESGNFALRWTFYIGKDGRILRVDREVNPATAGADIARALAELGIPKKQ